VAVSVDRMRRKADFRSSRSGCDWRRQPARSLLGRL